MANILKALNVKALAGIMGGTILVGAIVHFAPTSPMNSSSGAYSTRVSQTQNMSTGAWDIAQMALRIAQHIKGENLDQYDPHDPALQDVISYWKRICNKTICPEAQPTSLQCAMYVSTVYGMAGHPLPRTSDAVVYWDNYKDQPKSQEIPVKSGLPKVGDLIVWGGGEITTKYPAGIGHIAIVVDVQPPGIKAKPTAAVQLPNGKANSSTTAVQPPNSGTNPTATAVQSSNGSITVAQANDLKGGIVGGNEQIGYNLITPDPRVPAITMPGVHLYQMPLLPDLSVRTWQGYTVLGYIDNPSLIQDINTSMVGSYALTGQPTITADKINRVLETNHSPAVGTGQAIYNLGVKYKVDPVFALAFFQHESTFGTQGIARTTRSLSNERCIPDRPCVDQNGTVLSNGQTQNGYAQMNSWEDGYDHWYKLITGPTYIGGGLKTVDQIIPVYAPASDHNDVPAYIQSIKQAVGQWWTMQ